MVRSSRAFRFQFSWCPSAPHAYIGFNTFEPALRAVGYSVTELPGTHVMSEADHRKATEAEQEQTRKAVRDAIDAGEAVLFGSEEDGLLVGYESISGENPTGWLCRPGPLGGPPKPDEPYLLPISRMPWGLGRLHRTSIPMPRAETALWAIQTAIVNAERGTVEGKALKTGFAAWQKWIDELGPEAFEGIVEQSRQHLREAKRANEDALFGICLGNAWCYENLHFARLEAARYLRDVAGDLPEAARHHLEEAATAYDETSKALVEGDCFIRIAPYPWSMKTPATDWTDAMRQRQAQLLANALKHERAAVNALKAARVAMGLPSVAVPIKGRRTERKESRKA